jgi:hypothetical protein
MKRDINLIQASENVLALDEEKNVGSVKHLPPRRNIIEYLRIGIWCSD